MTENLIGDAAACARTLARIQGVTLDETDAALCGRLLAAVPGILAAAHPGGSLFDAPLSAHAALAAGTNAAGTMGGERA
ncbi:hypothetical protein D9623_31650 [Azospirillum brasilense]|uniref:MmgE/PrpD family protein n=1 Tax=Azospirillum brasilense TaxID=192 RepID=A0A0P0ET82_AZOBR|nr:MULTISPECIES: hypothetical protein [Azospirillum]ALJ39260.1 hypothetical protein AMK58_27745 [Azospirillum brasilense]MDW7556924.1 hypothetical protein [Azospirillum brasilense]MDW7596693.1 hypothetical protein [Azospirillum brasilense]MDW7631574.1 hypothetical protein [Azospirillum brasilense]MDX5950311.1 hypothetical protein [Azospirillum brasilense]